MTESSKHPPLSAADQQKIDAVRRKAYLLYEGKVVPHRSCGIALAETFNLPTQPFQSLRKGGITGEGECGAIKAGELVLGCYLGDPDPTGTVTPELRSAAERYREAWSERVDRGAAARQPAVVELDIRCNHLTAPFDDFAGAERQQFCTNIAAEVAQIVAELLIDFGAAFEVTAISGYEDSPGPDR